MSIIDSFRGEFLFLSNFYEIPVVYEGYCYRSAEHAFQAMKATNEKDRQYVADAIDPKDAKYRGREIECRPDWNAIKIDEMGKIVYCKFSQNLTMADKLIATGDAVLIEGNWWRDDYWGMVRDPQGNWQGENYLGRILMAVRKILVNTRKLRDGS